MPYDTRAARRIFGAHVENHVHGSVDADTTHRNLEQLKAFALEQGDAVLAGDIAGAMKPTDPHGPDFASDDAAELWIEGGQPELVHGPSGKTGYTSRDVRRSIAAAAEEDPAE